MMTLRETNLKKMETSRVILQEKCYKVQYLIFSQGFEKKVNLRDVSLLIWYVMRCANEDTYWWQKEPFGNEMQTATRPKALKIARSLVP